MSDPDEKREELKRVRAWLDKLRTDEEKLAAELGEESEGGTDSSATLRTRQRVEDEEAQLFDKLSPAEKLRLYKEEPATWKRLCDAKEREGVRKLFESN